MSEFEETKRVALELAHNPMDPPEVVVARANAYVAFLLGTAAVPQPAPVAGKKDKKVEPASSASGAGTATEAGTAGTGETTSAEKAGDAPLTGETASASSAQSGGQDGLKDTSAQTASKITYEDIRTMVLKLSVAKGRDAVFAFLERFGAKKTAQEISPSDYPQAMAALKTLVGE